MAKNRKERLAGIAPGSPANDSDRHALGQYYSPAIACDLICRLAITDPSCVVLDPACGDGEFLLAASRRLEQLHARQSSSHQAITVVQIHGIEIDASAARDARARLEDATPATHQVRINVVHGDFFDVVPGKAPFPATVGAVIGNPPYIRQELIKHKARVRAHLAGAGIDGRSDLYVYFFSRAEQWLEDGGRIGFLTSERYLDTRYGRGLQRFLLEHFAIVAVIAFDKQIFTDALVGTVITILEKKSSKEARARHVARFLRVKRATSIEAIERAITSPRETPGIEVDDSWNIALVPQHELEGTAKWRAFLFAPPVFFELQQSPSLVELDKIATIRRGITSGANEFFYRRESEFPALEVTYPGLRRYFRPLLKAIGQLDWLQLAPGDTDWHVLDVHGLVAEAINPPADAEKSSIDAANAEQRVKTRLNAMGHATLVRYIEDAEARDPSPCRNATCAGRAIWFDLGDLLLGGIGFPKEYWTKFICPLVDPMMAMDSRVYVVVPGDWPDMDSRVDKRKVLAAILNADLSAIFYECQGRVYAGQALDRASCMVFEASKLRIIDPRGLDTASLLAIQARFDALLAKERSLVPRKTRSTLYEVGSRANPEERARRQEYIKLRQALNESILGAIGLGSRVAEMQRNVQDLVELRRKRGWDDVQVLIL